MKREHTLKLQTLELLGLKEKDYQVYLACLRLGSAPLRKIAGEAELNRGTAYDALKRLQSAGLVSYMDAKRHRYFTAEDPAKLRGLATRREVALQTARQKLDQLLPHLRTIAGAAERRPAVRYWEGEKGVRDILEDVLSTTEQSKEHTYRVYSSADIRDLIAAAWPKFSAERKKRGVRVRAIALGEGGKTVGLDERKWLTKAAKAPTYIFIYGGKTAYVATDERKQLFGVIIDDNAIAATQKMIFDQLWDTLG